MDYKGQTAVLSAILVLVGMVILAPAITEKALAAIRATASGQCGPEGQTHPCQFTLVSKQLDQCSSENKQIRCGVWNGYPSESGTVVTWSTQGFFSKGNVFAGKSGLEKGSVTYKVGGGPNGGRERTAVLSFENPVIGYNKCSVSGIGGSCTAGKGMNAKFTYNLRNID